MMMKKAIIVVISFLIMISMLPGCDYITGAKPDGLVTGATTHLPGTTDIPFEYSELNENLIMQIIIKDSTNRELSHVLEHRAITESSPKEISTFSSWLYSYFEGNDPQNLDLAKSLMAKYIEINSKNSQLILDASDDPKYIVDYDGSLYDSNPELHFLWVTNPVFDVQTGYVIASLEYYASNEEYFGSGFIGLYKYSNGSLIPINKFHKHVLWDTTTSNATNNTK